MALVFILAVLFVSCTSVEFDNKNDPRNGAVYGDSSSSSANEDRNGTVYGDSSSSSANEECRGVSYNPKTQFCYNNSKIGNKCGTRTEVFDTDLYECREGKIYLGTPVLYEDEYYEAVLIDTRVWMARNLNYETTEGSACYDDEFSFCEEYGRLYEWETALKVCPPNWHLPTYNEWAMLRHYAGGSIAGTNLKATDSWAWDSNAERYGNGEDVYGFMALPGGRFTPGIDFRYRNYDAVWWTDSEYNETRANLLGVGYGFEYAYMTDDDKLNKFSVRCVKDPD